MQQQPGGPPPIGTVPITMPIMMTSWPAPPPPTQQPPPALAPATAFNSTTPNQTQQTQPQADGSTTQAGSAPKVSASEAGSAGVSTLAEDPRVERVVLAYLKRRGFTQTEEALRAEAAKTKAAAAAAAAAVAPANGAAASASPVAASSSSSSDIHSFASELSLDQHTHLLKQILHYSLAESSPDVYAHGFERLKKWINECLDVYRTELVGCLWPLYVHIFLQLVARGFPHDAHRFLARYRGEHELLHKAELGVLQNLTTDSDLSKCDVARWFQQRKVEVPMSSFSHQLLLTFLEEHNFLLLLKLVNDHLYIKVMTRKPLQLEGDMSSSAVTGSTSGVFTATNPQAVAHLNTTPIRWGVLPEYAAFTLEAQTIMRNKLRDQQLHIKMAKVKEAEEERKREEKIKKAAEDEKKAAEASAPAAAAVKEEDDEESAKKKARLEDGTAAAPAAAPGDTEMADAGEDTGAVAEEKEKKSKKAKKKDPNAPADLPAGGVNPLKETKEEKDAIERAIKKAIRMPEPMPVPKKEDQAVKLPPISAESRLRFLRDLSLRQKLSPSSLPSVCFYTFLNSLHTVNSVSISPDAALVSCALSDSTVRLYDLRDPTIRASTNPSTKAADLKLEDADATGLHADSDLLGATSVITGSTILNRRSGDESTKLPYTKLVGHSGPVYSTSLSPEGQYLLSSSEDCTTRLWNLETKKNLVVYKGHNYPVWSVSFSPLGYYFATGSHDATARLWSTNHVAPLRMFVGHNEDVDVVKFHPNCNYLATASSDSTARLWDIQTGTCVRLFAGHSGGVRSLAMDPEGRYAATGGEDGRVMIWDLGTGRQVSSYRAHTAAVTALDFSADGEVVASGGLDYAVQIIEAKKPHITQPIRTFHTKRTPVHYLRFTPRNLLLAAGVFNA